MTYKAFISYSHTEDDRLAELIQSALHKFAKPWYRRRALRVFRDKTSLAANPGLWPTLEANLAESEWLLLMASRKSAGSVWVQKEIQWWLTERSSAQMLMLLTEGELTWDAMKRDFDWEHTTALSRALSGRFADEPLYVDLRWTKNLDQLSLGHASFRAAVLDIAAPLHGIPKDELDGADVREQRRTRRLAAGGVAAVLAFAGVAVWQWREAGVQRDVAIAQSEIARQKQLEAEAAAKAEQIARADEAKQREEAQRRRAEAEQAAIAERAAKEQEAKERREAERQRNIAFSRELTAQAELARARGAQFLPRTVLLAAESMRLVPTLEGDSLLRQGLALLPGPVARFDHGSPVSSVTLSPDGRYLATRAQERTADLSLAMALNAAGKHTLSVWDVSSKRLLRTLHKGDDVRHVRFLPDGQRLMTAVDRTVHISRLADGASTAMLKHSFVIEELVLSPNGGYLAVQGRDLDNSTPIGYMQSISRPRQLRLWNLETLQPLPEIERSENLLQVAFAPSSRSLALVHFGVRIIDLATLRDIAAVTGKNIIRANFSPDGSRLITAGNDGQTRIWTVEPEAKQPCTIESSSGLIGFTDGGKVFVTKSPDGSGAALWDVDNCRSLTRVPIPGDPQLSLGPDGRMLMAVAGSTASLWSLNSNEQGFRELARVVHDQTIVSHSFGANGAVVATGGLDGAARLWRTDNGRPKTLPADFSLNNAGFETEAPGAPLVTCRNKQIERRNVEFGAIAHGASCAFHASSRSQDGKVLALSELEAGIRLLNSAGNELARIPRDDQVSHLLLSPDGRYLASATLNHNTVRIYENPQWQASSSRTFKYQESVTAMAFSPDSRHLIMVVSTPRDQSHERGDNALARSMLRALAGSNSVIHVVAAASGRSLGRVLVDGSVHSVAATPDGQRLITASTDGTARVWPLRGGAALLAVRHEVGSEVHTVALAPEGVSFATGGTDGTARIWELSSGRELVRLPHYGPVKAIRFTPDGRYLLTDEAEGPVRVWPLRASDLLAQACARLPRGLTADERRNYLRAENSRPTCPLGSMKTEPANEGARDAKAG